MKKFLLAACLILGMFFSSTTDVSAQYAAPLVVKVVNPTQNVEDAHDLWVTTNPDADLLFNAAPNATFEFYFRVSDTSPNFDANNSDWIYAVYRLNNEPDFVAFVIFKPNGEYVGMSLYTRIFYSTLLSYIGGPGASN